MPVATMVPIESYHLFIISSTSVTDCDSPNKTLQWKEKEKKLLGASGTHVVSRRATPEHNKQAIIILHGLAQNKSERDQEWQGMINDDGASE
ncbi:hypothetical protein BDA96_08G196900 [Sorghum bicolor]|uniref:Uncharacterized protein n=2 Tax=Sorghum bicolor TaxID=4558 RepID=A0A921QGP4_SORBI|nr:hypothetical protein SORBI_3008G179100 [Sorghum bicolor]KAG0521849.1 hypothetical protein BDA96_08G196900 [Sorghum bicolor]